MPKKKKSSADKTYMIATDVAYAPFEYKNDKQELVGIDISLLSEIAKDQNFKYKIVPLSFNSAMAGLESNKFDGVIAGALITEQRKLRYDFSNGYLKSEPAMAVRSDNNNIKSYEDLRGKKVAIKTGTESGNFANSIKNKYGFITKEFEDTPLSYEDVKSGNSVACFEDFPPLSYAIKQGLELKIIEHETECDSQCGFIVAKGKNQELLSMFNEGLSNIKKNGKYDEIIAKYISN